MTNKYTLITILILAGVLLVGSAYLKNGNQSSSQVSTRTESPVHGPHLSLSPDEYDFGKIRQSGGVVSTTFNVYNNGSEEVDVSDVLTSCSCTSAKIDKNIFKPGDSGKLTVMFDPNYHFEDAGRFFRTITIKSNAHGKEPEVKIFVEVNYDLGKDKLKFPGKAD